MFDIKSELVLVASAKWKHIGLALRLNPDQLNVIEKGKSDLDDCLTEMLTLWLNRNYNTKKFGEPSWEMLTSAVGHRAGGNNPGLAKKVILLCRIAYDNLMPMQVMESRSIHVVV